MNICTFAGNLGADMEVRYTPNSKAVGAFSLPVKRGWGEQEQLCWCRCKLFGERAEKLQPYLLKGTKVVVSGNIGMEEWEKDGVKHSQLTLYVGSLELMSQNSHSVTKTVQKPANQAQKQPDFHDDDIPF